MTDETTPRTADRARAEKRPALVVVRGELLSAPVAVDRDGIIIGRALEADVRINDARASRLHARVSVERDRACGEVRYRITDLGSTNGVLVNDRKVREAYLHDGDKITIGTHILRFDFFDDVDHEFQRQLRRLLVHDELTGLLTSKSFFSELRREAARAAREKRSFCVLMMDIDHFKRVNDSYGHLVGSQTLEEVATVLSGALRAGDLAARYGGEEFAAVLADADYECGAVVAEQVRAAIEGHTFFATRHGAGGETRRLYHRLTISVGVAAYPADSHDPAELVELADAALYRAKRDGRNRVREARYAESASTATEPTLAAVPTEEHTGGGERDKDAESEVDR